MGSDDGNKGTKERRQDMHILTIMTKACTQPAFLNKKGSLEGHV